ncbi:hypothetical protein [Arthrobacter sp. UYCo732]|uniref:hypothetical protein n=1 Tax=Arthrobacter sp. UYCo732 TaxID=3156336 RepID=UPI003399BE02
MGEIEIYYSESVASGRRQIARDSPEPSWIGGAKVWTWILNGVLALRAAARFRAVQYLAALIFIVSSAGMIAAVSLLVIIAASMVASLKTGDLPIELLMFGPAAVWLAVSPIIGVFTALFGRRRTSSLPLSVLRFMGAPARESLRAWDGIFFHVDKKIGRVIARPLLWLLRKPRRFIIVAAVLAITFLLVASGILLPGHLVSWANQFGRGVKFVGGTGVGAMFWVVFVLIILFFVALITYLFLILYVWLRSALVALPLLFLFVLSKDSDLAAVKPFWDPAVDLVTYLPPGITEAYDQPVDNLLTAVLVNLSRVFIGNPGAPTTIGMILTGVLIGWLPYMLEQLDKPTPREVVARHGWVEANEQAQANRKHLVYVNALWGGGLAVLFFAFSPTWYLVSTLEKTVWYTFLFVVIPVGTGLLVVRAIVKKVRKSGRITRPRPLDMSAEETSEALGAPEKLPSIAENYTPMARLLSEAQRLRSIAPAEEPAPI